MLRGSKALKRLDGKSVKNLKQEIGGNPRAMELLDKIAHEEFKEREFTWKQLKDLFPEMLERMIREKSEADDFTPLFLDKLFSYLTKSQRLLADILSIYRNPVPKEAVEAHNVSIERQDRRKLVDFSLLECIDTEGKRDLYYVHRLTAQYLLAQMEPGVKNNYNVRAAKYFEGISTGEGKKYLENDIESRWHYLQAGEWDKAAEITFELEKYLTLHGFPQWSMELLRELEIARLNITNQLVTYGQIGNLYQHFGEYDNSINFYKKAYEIAKKSNDPRNSATALHQIGYIYQDQGRYNEALRQYEKGRKSFEEMGAQKGLAAALHQIGRIYEEKGDYDEALRQYQQSLEIAEKIGDIPGMALHIGQMGKVYLIKKEYPKALKLSLQSLMIFLELGSPKAEIVIRNILDIREHLPEEQFNALLKEFDLEPGLFDKSETEAEDQQ